MSTEVMQLGVRNYAPRSSLVVSGSVRTRILRIRRICADWLMEGGSSVRYTNFITAFKTSLLSITHHLLYFSLSPRSFIKIYFFQIFVLLIDNFQNTDYTIIYEGVLFRRRQERYILSRLIKLHFRYPATIRIDNVYSSFQTDYFNFRPHFNF